MVARFSVCDTIFQMLLSMQNFIFWSNSQIVKNVPDYSDSEVIVWTVHFLGEKNLIWTDYVKIL